MPVLSCILASPLGRLQVMVLGVGFVIVCCCCDDDGEDPPGT